MSGRLSSEDTTEEDRDCEPQTEETDPFAGWTEDDFPTEADFPGTAS